MEPPHLVFVTTAVEVYVTNTVGFLVLVRGLSVVSVKSEEEVQREEKEVGGGKMNCECGELLKYLGDEDDGTPIFKCTSCNKVFAGDVSEHEHMVARSELIGGV